MNGQVKRILQRVGVYHFLQSAYRSGISSFRLMLLRRNYASLAGQGWICNVCGASYSRFAPRFPKKEDAPALAARSVIAGYGENCICPNCGSTSRERLVIAMIGPYLEKKEMMVLHVAPEEKVFTFMKGKCRLITGDLHPGFYRHLDRNVIRLDLMQLPFETESFDIVIANHVMEHIPDDRKAMSELFRVLRPGGVAVMQVPFSAGAWDTVEDPEVRDPRIMSERFGQRDHVRIYNLDDYASRLNQAGFEVEIIRYPELIAFHLHAIQPGEHFLKIRKPVIS